MLASGEQVPVPCVGNDHLWLGETVEVLLEAAEACEVCPVLDACREYALRWREEAGVWGGTTPADRGHRMPQPATRRTPRTKIEPVPDREVVCADCSKTFTVPRRGKAPERCEPCRRARRLALSAERVRRSRARRGVAS